MTQSTTARQPTLFGLDEPTIDESVQPQRVELADGAWIEHWVGYLRGDAALLERIEAGTTWHANRRPMYDRIVDVPRLTASFPRDGAIDPVLTTIRSHLERVYGEPITSISAALYRDGRDSVAPHGDQIARDIETSVMGTVSVGARRHFVLSRVEGRGHWSADLGEGDLLVMGGTIQRTWRHAVPKTARPVGPRMSIMFRPTWLG